MSPAEILSAYLKERGRGALSRLSEKCGLSKGHLHDIANVPGTQLTVQTAKALEAGTKIKAAVWLGLAEYRGRK